MEIETSKINFDSLYKVVKIEFEIVTFKRYNVSTNPTLMKPGYSFIEFGKEIGEETLKCKPDVIAELAGKVGMIIKGFEIVVAGKKVKKVLVSKIIKLDE